MRCRHCGVSADYYSNIEHAQRRSCLVSESGYHEFVTSGCYAFIMVYQGTQDFLQSVFDAASNSYSTRTYVPDDHND